jgi:hypothetical protein
MIKRGPARRRRTRMLQRLMPERRDGFDRRARVATVPAIPGTNATPHRRVPKRALIS